MRLELFNDAGVAKQRRQHERGQAQAVVRIDLGPLRQQQGYHVGMALAGGSAQRGLTPPIAAVHLRTVGQEHAGGVPISMVTRQHQEGVAPRVGQIHGDPAIDHAGERCGFALAGMVQRAWLPFGLTPFPGGGDLDLQAHVHARFSLSGKSSSKSGPQEAAEREFWLPTSGLGPAMVRAGNWLRII